MVNEINYFDDAIRKKLTRFVFVFVFINQCYLFYSNILFTQLSKPIFKFPDLDITYWIFHLLQIPELITANTPLSTFIDLTMFIIPLFCIIYPLKRFLIITYLVLFFTYFITFNSYSLFHCHVFIGVLFAIFPFSFKNNKTSTYLWEAVRFFLCFIYFSAFIWKLYRGSVFNELQLTAIIQDNLAAYLTFNGETFLAESYRYLLTSPTLLFTIELIGIILMEGIFVIGFFTKRIDKLLFINSFLLHIGFLFFADATMFPLLILSLTLINLDQKKQKTAP